MPRFLLFAITLAVTAVTGLATAQASPTVLHLVGRALQWDQAAAGLRRSYCAIPILL